MNKYIVLLISVFIFGCGAENSIDAAQKIEQQMNSISTSKIGYYAGVTGHYYLKMAFDKNLEMYKHQNAKYAADAMMYNSQSTGQQCIRFTDDTFTCNSLVEGHNITYYYKLVENKGFYTVYAEQSQTDMDKLKEALKYVQTFDPFQ